MAGRGRGRGRGILPPNFEDPVVGSWQGSLEQSFQDLTCYAKGDQVNRALEEALKSCKQSEEEMGRVIDLMFQRCEDWHLSNVIGELCSQLSNTSLNDVKFRDKLLRFVQKKYQDRLTSRQKSSKTFLALVAFLAQILKHVRTADQKPLTILVTPVSVMFELCFDESCTGEEVACATAQLISLESIFDVFKSEQVSNFKKLIRSILVDAKFDKSSRESLLDAFEICAKHSKSS